MFAIGPLFADADLALQHEVHLVVGQIALAKYDLILGQLPRAQLLQSLDHFSRHGDLLRPADAAGNCFQPPPFEKLAFLATTAAAFKPVRTLSPYSLYLFDGRLLYAAPGIESEPHSHYAVSVLIARGEPFQIRMGETLHPPLSAAVLAPNAFHELHAPRARMIVLHLDPDCAEFGPLSKRLNHAALLPIAAEELADLGAEFDRALAGELDCGAARRLYERTLQQIGGGQESAHRHLDSRIEQAILVLKRSLPESKSAAELAQAVGLSEHRFMHLFKDELGLPVRRYTLWLRLHAAARQLRNGGTLTDAAHAAGFSDSAHLSRTFKEMFGVQPSFFLGQNSIVTTHFCADDAAW